MLQGLQIPTMQIFNITWLAFTAIDQARHVDEGGRVAKHGGPAGPLFGFGLSFKPFLWINLAGGITLTLRAIHIRPLRMGIPGFSQGKLAAMPSQTEALGQHYPTDSKRERPLIEPRRAHVGGEGDFMISVHPEAIFLGERHF